ncbi:MAG: Mu transposase C-terminal domain-containing protein [Psychrilyobacter sp.]|nr:Mu transposase C-terminal domain-containing protein [Psychrilyobacter sp.]
MSKNIFLIIEPFLKKEKKLKVLSEEHNIPYSTLKRWIKSYKEKGKEGLKKKVRADKDTFKKVDNKTMDYIKNEYSKTPYMNVTELYKRYLSQFKGKTENLISYNTIYRIGINIDPFSEKYMKKNVKNIREANSIYRISTEEIKIKGLEDGVFIVVIYDVYDDSILNYKLYMGELELEGYMGFIYETFLKNQVEDYIVIPKNIIIDNIKIKNSEKIKKISEKLNLNISSTMEKNYEIEKFIRFLEKDISKTFNSNLVSIELLNLNLDPFICNVDLTSALDSKKTYDINKIDVLLETTHRKIQNYGIRFKNNIYYHKNMDKYIGKKVTLRYNRFNTSILKIFFCDEFLFTVNIVK